MAVGKVQGLEKVVGNLNREVARIKTRTVAGLFRAGLILEAEAKRRVPVDTGNLKNSGYTRKASPTTVEVGFQAAYAVFVHEILDAAHHVGEAKYLENAIKAKRRDMLAAIREEAQIR